MSQFELNESPTQNPSNVISIGAKRLVAPAHKPVVTPTDIPITSELRTEWNRLNAISAYKSDFDFSGFEALERRTKNEIRGGMLFKTPMKLVNHHSSCSKCHYTFEIDTYGRGCVHNCSYCYAKEQLTKHGYWNRPYPVPVDISEIRKIFYTIFETDKANKWRDVISKKVPLRIGSMSDSFMLLDNTYKVTKELLRILSHYEYPYIVFTRSDLVGRDDYMAALRPDLSSIQFSISGGDERLTKAIEPGAPSVLRRLKAMERLSKAGFRTAVRINPLFPIFPDGYFSDPEYIERKFGNDIPRFDLFDFSFIQQIKDYGANTVLAGFVRLSQHSIKAISRDTGINLSSFFREELNHGMKSRIYSDKEIAAYYWKIHSEANKAKIRYSTCYIGNGIKDYYQYQDLWSNKQDCCDVVGKIKSFQTTSQSISWETRSKFSNCSEEVQKAKNLEIAFDSDERETSKSNTTSPSSHPSL